MKNSALPNRHNPFSRRNGHLSYDIAVTVLLAFIGFICLYPFWNVAIISLNDAQDTVRGGLYFWPRKFTLESYREVFKNKELIHAAFISLARTVSGTVIALFFNTLLAYGMSKKDLFGSKFFGYFFVFTMYFGGGIVPYYMVLKTVKLIDTFWVYIIPGAISVYNMILIRIYMESLPQELEESAYLDGAGDIVVLFGIVLPLSKPVLATIALFTAVGQWSSWFDTNLYTYKTSLKTLQFILVQILNNYDLGNSKSVAEILQQASKQNPVSSDSIRMATAMVVTVPIIVVYPFVQKYFVKGIMIGAVKG
ncbi:MAG: carbohydrate ABC transporter permease [Clostridia bacterium]|nr:carbohydrate ABC transporter permease [Clostridia bacterium]